MRTRFFAGAALVLLLWPGDARAGCALAPQVEFAPADGALPPGGVVYVFVHKSTLYARSQVDALRVESRGSAIASQQRMLLKNERYDVIELALPKSTGEVRVIARVGDETFLARYTLAAQTRAPEVETRLVSARYQFRGGCPGSDGFAIALEPRAAAYRVEWPDETAGAPPHRLIVPDGADAKARYGELVIGSQGCGMFGIDAPSPFVLEVTPLFSDGRAGATFTPDGCKSSAPVCHDVRHGARVETECSGSVTHCSGPPSWSFAGPISDH